MIVRHTDSGLELVTQPDHARLASEVFDLWRSEGVPEHPRREALLLAVREHDNGWREADAAPHLDPRSGRPVDFRDLPRRPRFELWRRGLDRLADAPWAAALVAHHALAIHRERPADTWGGFRLEMGERRDAFLEAAGLDRAELAADYRYLAWCDTISLIACGAFDRAVLGDLSIRRVGDTVEIDPFPLAGATTFQIPVRSIGAGPYRDGAHLIGHLARARWGRRPIRLAPARP